jgi:polar amino acid transport system substrate-binding protein
MKRLAVAVGVFAVAGAAFAAWSLAASTGSTPTGGARANGLAAKKLPPLPPEVKSRKRWIIGVKCDFPPFGYTDVRGRVAGYDVEIARWFARFAFGKSTRVTFECVTTASRIPAVQSRRVDIIIATLTYFPDRAEQIDFSIPYFAATGRLLIRKGDSVSVGTLAGKTVTTTGGSIYDTWIKRCFPQTKLLLLTSPSLAVQALKDGRADTFMFDDAFLLEFVLKDPDLRVTRDKFLRIPWGIGIRKGNTAMKRWVDSRLLILKRRDEFTRILRRNSAPALFDDFAAYTPTPKRTLKYPAGKTREEALPCP